MTPDEYKEIFKKVLPNIPIPKMNQKSLERMKHDFDKDPFAGHCANATAAGWVLFGAKFDLKPFKEKNKPGNESHYWLANPTKGKELEICDLSVFHDTKFDYTCRQGVGWITRLTIHDDLKCLAQQIYDAVIKEIKNPSAP